MAERTGVSRDDALGEARPRGRGVGEVRVVLVGLRDDGVDTGALADLELDLVDPAGDVVGARGGDVAVAGAHERATPGHSPR